MLNTRFAYGAAATALGFAFIFAGSSVAQAQPDPISPVQGDGAAAPFPAAAGADPVLYSQNNHDSGDGIVSEYFLHAHRPYDSRGADDFLVPRDRLWTITEVDVTGAYRDGIRAQWENVVIYNDNDGLPGDSIHKWRHLEGDDDGSGSLNIPLNGGIILPYGTYWVSVQVVEDGHGFWVWETRRDAHGVPAAFRNPRDGFGTGCVEYSVMQECAGDLGEGPDYMFTLRGTAKP